MNYKTAQNTSFLKTFLWSEDRTTSLKIMIEKNTLKNQSKIIHSIATKNHYAVLV